MRALLCRNLLAICLIGLVSTTTLLAQTQRVNRSKSSEKSITALDAFYRGYYLQNDRNDPAAALKAYKRSLALGANSELRDKIDKQISSLQEDLAVADFAQLMPNDAIAYVEVNRAADHAEKLPMHWELLASVVKIRTELFCESKMRSKYLRILKLALLCSVNSRKYVARR